MNTARVAFVLLTLSTFALPARANCGCASRPCEATTLETVTVPRPVPATESTIEFAIVDRPTDVAGGWVPVLLLLSIVIALRRALARRNALLVPRFDRLSGTDVPMTEVRLVVDRPRAAMRLRPCAAS